MKRLEIELDEQISKRRKLTKQQYLRKLRKEKNAGQRELVQLREEMCFIFEKIGGSLQLLDDNYHAIFKILPLTVFSKQILPYISFSDCVRLTQTCKLWMLIFSYGDNNVWNNLLPESSRKRHFSFLLAEEKLSPVQYFYLNRWGCSYCQYCGVFAGTPDDHSLPVSVYTQVGSVFKCVNPECDKELDEKIASLELARVFTNCGKHTWAELGQDIFLPNGDVAGNNLAICTRCSLLRDFQDDSVEDVCARCHRTREMCAFYSEKKKSLLQTKARLQKKKDLFRKICSTLTETEKDKWVKKIARLSAKHKLLDKEYGKKFACMKCESCRLHDSKCVCSFCDDCQLCKGCDRCQKKKKKLCECVVCEECYNLISCVRKGFISECQCENLLSLSE